MKQDPTKKYLTPSSCVVGLVLACALAGHAQEEPVWRESLEGVAIPEYPASGRIHGQPFRYEAGQIENGILTLRQGQEFFADRQLQVFLFTKKGEIPAGRRFVVTKGAAVGMTPHVHLASKAEGQDTPQHASFMRDYVMTLEFGPITDKNLPGRIYVCLPDERHSVIAGTFEVDVKGLIFTEGKPALTIDSFEVLEHVGSAFLQQQHPGEALEVLGWREQQFTHPYPTIAHQLGYAEVEYRAGNAPVVIKRLQFIKDPEGWRVLRTLNLDQLHAAHPEEPPAQTEIMRVLEYLAAQQLEQEAPLEHPGKAIYQLLFSPSYNDGVGLGACEVRYTIGLEGPRMTKRFLFRLQDGIWTLDRALAADEKVDYRTGRVERE